MSEHPILAACDDARSEAAVRYGARLAGVLHEPLVLASAYTYRPVALSARAIPPTANMLEYDAAEQRLQLARSLVPEGVEVRDRVLPAAGIAVALADAACEDDASVIVTGRDADGRVSHALLEHAPCPIAVVADVPGAADAELGMIGVAYDGSDAADRAVTAAMHLAIRTGAHVRIITVRSAGAAPDAEADLAAATIAEAVPSRALSLQGPAGPRLVEASASLDLLVCGSHGRGRLLSRILGSVSAQLVDEAACPVLVIPPRTWHRATRPLGLSTAAA
jgi:nucleotide-binding universal stress UspA family protein